MTGARILGICGSPRKKGNSDILLGHMLKGAGAEGAATAKSFLRDYEYRPCIGCERCRATGECSRFHDGMQLLYPEVSACKGLVLVSPVHNYNITAWMKAFIDRLYCYYNFTKERPGKWSSKLAGQGRKAVIAAVAEQNEISEMRLTLDAMRLPLEALGYDVIAEFPVPGIFDKGKVAQYSETLQKAEKLGTELVLSMKQSHDE